MINRIIENVEKEHLRKEPLKFEVGDTVDVHTRIIEGEKERIQVFSGTLIMIKGRGMNQTFTVRAQRRIRGEEPAQGRPVCTGHVHGRPAVRR